MIDLHTHILPGMDDGSKDADESLWLLKRQELMGVSAVLLTSHFYRNQENAEHFCSRRAEAFTRLMDAYRGTIKLAVGAEVKWFPAIDRCQEIELLCLGNSRYLLLEMPFSPWTGEVLDSVYNLASSMCVTPIIAHVERYRQSRSSLEALFEMGFPLQVNVDTLQDTWTRRKAIRLFECGLAWFLASDCHNMSERPPNLRYGQDILRKRLTGNAFERVEARSQKIECELFKEENQRNG